MAKPVSLEEQSRELGSSTAAKRSKRLDWKSHPDGDNYTNGRHVPYRIARERPGEFRIYVHGVADVLAASLEQAREHCQQLEDGVATTLTLAAPGGAAVADPPATRPLAAAPIGPVVTLVIPVGQLAEDQENVRKEYDPDALDQLGESMKLHGQLEPIGVRPAKAGGQTIPDRWVVIWGHRRLRAASRKKLPTLRAEVREASDDQVPALQLAENDQRQALKALERSNAHQQMKARGLTTKQIADATTTSEATVRDSLKLQELVPAVKKAWAERKLEYSHALEFAKVPTKVQPAALTRYFEIADEQDGDLPSVRQLRFMLRNEFMFDLAKAPFAIADAQLLPEAGSCSTCIHRTGAQPELFSHLAKEPDVCTNKPCFDKKLVAFLARAEQEGRRVLNEGTAKQMFNEYSSSDSLQYNASYVLADEKPYGAKKKYRDQVDPKDVALVKNPATGSVLEVISKSALPKKTEPDRPVYKKDPSEVRRERENKARNVAQIAILDEMARSKDVEIGTDLFLRAVARGMLQSVQSEPVKQLCKRLGLEPKPGDDYRQLLWDQFLDTLGQVQLRRVVLQLAYADRVQPFSYASGMNECLLEGAKMLKVDVKKFEANARKELSAELKEKADRKGKKPKTDDEVLAAKLKKIAGSKLTPHQQKALVEKVKAGHLAKKGRAA